MFALWKKVHLVDNLINHLTIENYPGFNKISGPELAYSFYRTNINLNIPFINEEVIEIEDKTSYKIIKTNKKTYACKGII